jgi:phosphomannomutase/phosphoglucomutase
MKSSKAIVGGEGSSGGAIVFPSRCRDGILTLLMLLSISAKKQKKLSDIVEELPKYYTLGKNMPFGGMKHDGIRKFLKSHYSGKGFEVIETGGIKGSLKIMTGKNSFMWFRASKTESDVFRIIADSDNKEEAERLIEEAVKVFSEANGS